jgi:hypothetical protein
MHIEMFEALRAAGVPEDRAEKATKATAEMIENTARTLVQEAVQPVLLALGRLDARMDGMEKRLDSRIDGLEKRLDSRIDGLEKSINRNDLLMRWIVGALIGAPVFIFTLTTIAKTFGLIK